MILLCTATLREMDACLAPLGLRFESAGQGGSKPWMRDLGNLVLAVTGVGIPLTLARLLPLVSARRPDLMVNAGIAGAYPGSGLAIGEVVAGESEAFGDLGMETPEAEAFLPLAGFPWADEEYRRPLPLAWEPLLQASAAEGASRPGPRLAKGCTVNACAGRPETGERRRALFGADFETMEGAAAALAGRELDIRIAEVRAISNIASTRDMRPERIALALENLGAFMGPWLGSRA